MAAVRRATQGGRLACRAVDSPDQCWPLLRERPESFVLVEVAARPAAVVDACRWLLALRQRFPHSRAAVVGEAELRRFAWSLCEAGAVQVACRVAEIAGLVRLARRHCQAASKRPTTWREAVLAKIPWNDPWGEEPPVAARSEGE